MGGLLWTHPPCVGTDGFNFLDGRGCAEIRAQPMSQHSLSSTTWSTGWAVVAIGDYIEWSDIVMSSQLSDSDGHKNVLWSISCSRLVREQVKRKKFCAATPLTVEYLTPANDASGRLYATQICAQRLPLELRLLIYGSTHKEVDLTGAHYELIRAMTGSVTLPPTRLPRGRLREIWTGDHIAAPELSFDEVKMLPIRVINTGAAQALKHVTNKGLSLPPWIEAFAFDLEAARDIFTAHVRREVRPRVEALAKNRHFFAAEAIEAIFMQLFLLEVRKRTDIPSIIWLHDGLWTGREVDDQILHAAECHVRRLLFPHSDLTSSLFSIVDLHEDWQAAVSTCPPPLTLHCLPNAIKGPDEVGVEGRSLGNSRLVIDKRLSASSPATLTGLASVPEPVGANQQIFPIRVKLIWMCIVWLFSLI